MYQCQIIFFPHTEVSLFVDTFKQDRRKHHLCSISTHRRCRNQLFEKPNILPKKILRVPTLSDDSRKFFNLRYIYFHQLREVFQTITVQIPNFCAGWNCRFLTAWPFLIYIQYIETSVITKTFTNNDTH